MPDVSYPIITTMDRKNPPPCRICGNKTVFFGALDFGVSGNDYFAGRRMFADTGVMIEYCRCVECGFLMTPAFGRFTLDDYERFVYNDAYIDADPPFLEERPLRDAQMCSKLLGFCREEASVLDYGGGAGRMARELQKNGFARAESIDPLYQPDRRASFAKADVITSFEVIEHVHDQHALMTDIRNLLQENGIFIFSTQLQPDNIRELGVGWWYVQPRNAHISIHSRESLDRLLTAHGFSWTGLCPDLHLATRTENDLYRRLLAQTDILRSIRTSRNPLPPKGI